MELHIREGAVPGTNIMVMLVKGAMKGYSSSEITGRKSLVVNVGDGIDFMVRAKWDNGKLISYVYTAGESRQLYETEDRCVSQADGVTKDYYEGAFINYIPGSDEPIFVMPTKAVNETDGLSELIVATMGPSQYNVVSSNADHTVLINRDDRTLRIFGKWDGDEFRTSLEWI